VNKSEARDAIFHELAPLFPGWRLVKKDDGFVRAIPGGWQKIQVGLIDHNPVFKFSLAIAIRLNAAEDVANRFSGATPDASKQTCTTLTQLSYFYPGTNYKEFKVSSKEEVAAAASELAQVITSKVLPLLDERQTIGALDAALNGDDPSFDKSDKANRTLHALVVARLNNNPRFDSLVEEYAQSMQGFPENARAKVAAAVSFLRSPDFPSAHTR
jgi:hypothetical protein